MNCGPGKGRVGGGECLYSDLNLGVCGTRRG